MRYLAFLSLWQFSIMVLFDIRHGFGTARIGVDGVSMGILALGDFEVSFFLVIEQIGEEH